MKSTGKFISEDDLDTFAGWLADYQKMDPATMAPDELTEWRKAFEDSKQSVAATPKVGLMKLSGLKPGEHRYAVAVREGTDMWLALWVRRSQKGEVFVLLPRTDPGWDPHTSYHFDGTFHSKSHKHKVRPQKRQPLTGAFRGIECLGAYGGYGPKSVGAICDPTQFSDVVEVRPGVLGPRRGLVMVDLLEPGHPWVPGSTDAIVAQRVFQDAIPWLVVTVVEG